MIIQLSDLRYNTNNGGEVNFMVGTKLYRMSRNSQHLTKSMQKFIELHDNGIDIDLDHCEIVE